MGKWESAKVGKGEPAAAMRKRLERYMEEHGIALKEALDELGSEADFVKATFQTSWFLPVGDHLDLAGLEVTEKEGRVFAVPQGINAEKIGAELRARLE